MKHYCARDKKRYRPSEVGSHHCDSCTISRCRIDVFPLENKKKFTKVQKYHKQ